MSTWRYVSSEASVFSNLCHGLQKQTVLLLRPAKSVQNQPEFMFIFLFFERGSFRVRKNKTVSEIIKWPRQ